MNDRVPAAIAVVSSIAIVIYACATTPRTTNTPSTSDSLPPGMSDTTNRMPSAQGPGGPQIPLTDSARRVRDSVNAVRRDSAAAFVLRSIAGRENQPAESVFKNIKILKGVPAGRLVNIMNMGFGRSLGVSCGFCHVPGKWDLDDKDEKNTARLMFAMVQTINRDYLSKVPNDRGGPPMANCFTCHRGSPRPMSQRLLFPRVALFAVWSCHSNEICRRESALRRGRVTEERLLGMWLRVDCAQLGYGRGFNPLHFRLRLEVSRATRDERDH
jgi:hypothetical protein